MKVLNGNSVLIIESDQKYNKSISEVFAAAGAQIYSAYSVQDGIKRLRSYEYDIIICSYYLSDGLIYDVIDWSKTQMCSFPIFISIGSSMHGDEQLLNRKLISSVFHKGQSPELLVDKVQRLLFDFDEFYKNLLLMIDPKGISLELIVNKETMEVQPIEMTSDGIYISLENCFEQATFGHLRIAIYEKNHIEHFMLLGSLGLQIQGGQHFRINEAYSNVWDRLLLQINEKQTSISGYLNRVAGE